MKFVAKDYSKKILTIPNILTIFRIILIPVIVWVYYYQNNPKMAALLLILSGITDIVDGFIARKFNMISNFGKGLDPVADKLTQFILLICLVTKFPRMIVPCFLLFVKELVSAITALIAIRKTGKVEGATWHGKLSTVIIYIMLFVHIIWPEISGNISLAIISLSVVIMLISCVLYNMRSIEAVKQHSTQVKA